MNEELKAMLESVIQDALKPLNKEIKMMKNGITSMKSEMTSMKAQLEENTQLAKAIYHRQEETDAKLESLAMDVHKIQGELTSLKEGQERQDRILESLALRSLEQETELRELKRVK